MKTLTLPNLNEGERYAGLILSKDGASSYHLILLPGEAGFIDWEDARKWAAGIGGELPTRCEQALLYANLKEQFKGAWYWSDDGIIWCQNFANFTQDNCSKISAIRARAIRRVHDMKNYLENCQ